MSRVNIIKSRHVIEGRGLMRSASIFKNGRNQAIRLPKEFEFAGVTEVEIRREGESVVLMPKRKTWTSFSEVELADDDFLVERNDVMEKGRLGL